MESEATTTTASEGEVVEAPTTKVWEDDESLVGAFGKTAKEVPIHPNFQYIMRPRLRLSATPVVPPDRTDIRGIVVQRQSWELVDPGDIVIGRQHAEAFRKALSPVRILLTIFGRLPVISVKKPDGSVYFKHHPGYFPSLLFFFVSLVLTVILLLVMVNMCGMLLDIPRHPTNYTYSWPGQARRISKGQGRLRAEERYIFMRNVVPLLIITTALIHCFVGSYSFLVRRHYIATYFTFWQEAVALIRIDAAAGVRASMLWVIGIYFGITLAILGIGCGRFIPIGAGASGIFTMLLTRVFVPHFHSVPDFGTYRDAFGIFLGYILITSKTYVLLFLFVCKLLKNVVTVWNGRLNRVLHLGGGEDSAEKKTANRTGYSHLFKDHVCILDLIEGCDHLFRNIIESYYATQVALVCFEIYYFYRSQAAKREFDRTRQMDGILMLLHLIQTFYVLITVSVNAADVSEKAIQGLETIRRKGMLGKKTDEELYFLLSMYISYTGHFETALMGGKYFVIDRAFLVTVTGIIFSYFIILIQFTPNLAMDLQDVMNLDKEILEQDGVVSLLLEQVEQLRG